MQERLRRLLVLAFTTAQGYYVYRRAAKLLKIGTEIKEADNDEGRRVTGHAVSMGTDNTIFIAKKRERIVGYVEWVRRSEQHYPLNGHWLDGLMVVTIYRGMGIGEKLTRTVIEKSKKEGAEGLSVLVFEDNHRAIRLYHKLNFNRRVIPALEKILEKRQDTPGHREVCMYMPFN